MSTHDSFQTMLAVREDLSAAEEARLASHLAGCVACRERAHAYDHLDAAMRDLPPLLPPPSLEAVVHARVAAARRQPMRRNLLAWRWPSLGPAVALVAILLTIGITTGQRTATSASAYDLLRRAADAAANGFPYTGTSIVSYQDLPLYTLPSTAAIYAGNHRAVVHWAARDASHFRVDIHTIDPVLDSGSETIVVNGNRILSYDTRTGTAGLGTLYPIPFMQAFRKSLLPYLRNGAVGGAAPEPDPSQSIQGYLRRTESEKQRIHGYARLVGETRLDGRKVDIVDFAPLGVTCTSKGMTPSGQCRDILNTWGRARVWIARDHPFILQYKELGARNLHALQGLDRVNFEYRVTSLHYGTGPSMAALAFHPPVPVHNVGHWTVGSSAGTDIPHNDRFVYAPAPTRIDGKRWVEPGGAAGGQEVGPLPVVTTVNILYTQGQHVITYLAKRHPFGLYAAGRYVFIQERTQVHDLPAVLRRGKPAVFGPCRIWTGAYATGERWAAFQKRTTSVLISTNALSEQRLSRYAATQVCLPW